MTVRLNNNRKRAVMYFLERFPSPEGLPSSQEEVKRVFQSPRVEGVVSFALGPEGTNISQASQEWVEETGIKEKTTTILESTPEECLQLAREITEPNVVSLFWTCAVFYALKDLFFTNPDVYPFFIQHGMRLDEMQLATREDILEQINQLGISPDWVIASHPSPAPLLEELARSKGCIVTEANSNSDAAQKCASEEVNLCMTTESAREIHDLIEIHSFGSPLMIFFGGITSTGAEVIRRVYSELQEEE